MISDNLVGLKFTNNLQYLMDKNDFTSVDLAKSIGVSPELIVKLKRGSLNNPTLKVLVGIAKLFNISISNLVFDDLTNYQHLELQKYISSTSYIPIIDWSDLNKVPNANIIGYSVVLRSFPTNVFAVKLDSDYGLFSREMIIFIDNKLTIKNNDYVVVLNRVNSVVNIRQIVIDGDYYLKSINPQINTITSYNEDEYLIYGIIVASEKLELFRDIK